MEFAAAVSRGTEQWPQYFKDDARGGFAFIIREQSNFIVPAS